MHSFSNKDLNLFIEYGLEILRGIDEKFIYELNRNPEDLDKMFSIAETDEFSVRHNMVIARAKRLNVGYRRWKRE